MLKKYCANSKKWFPGKAIIMLSALIHFAFLNAYYQTFRSSTIEPFFESLPNNVENVDVRTSLVMIWKHFDVASGLWYFDFSISLITTCSV